MTDRIFVIEPLQRPEIGRLLTASLPSSAFGLALRFISRSPLAASRAASYASYGDRSSPDAAQPRGTTAARTELKGDRASAGGQENHGDPWV
jgi:hypothetical protein